MWVCGAFQTEYEGASLKDVLMKQLDERGLILLGTGDDGFCDQFPGAVVSVKSRTWDDKNYQTWSSGWYKVGRRNWGSWAFSAFEAGFMLDDTDGTAVRAGTRWNTYAILVVEYLWNTYALTVRDGWLAGGGCLGQE